MYKDTGLNLTEREIAATFESDHWAERFPPVLTIEQAAELLQVRPKTLCEWRSKGRLDSCARRLGKRIRIHRDRLIQWYFNGHVQPIRPTPPVEVEVPQIAESGYHLRLRGNRWYVDVHGLGKQIRRSLKTSDLDQAKTRAATLVASIRARAPTPAAGTGPTLIDAAVAAYLNHVEANRLAPKTISKYRWSMRQLQDLAKERGVTELPDINLAFFDAYQQKRNARGVAPKTMFNEAISIKQFLNFAVSRDMIAANPLKKVRMRRPKPPPQPFWTIEQVQSILAAAKKSPYYNVYLLLARTGMRISEVRFLTWKDVDLDRKLLFVREKQIGAKPTEIWKPKSGQQRVVPLSSDVVDMLADLPHKCRWVFRQPPNLPRPSKSLQFNDRHVLTRLKAVLKKLGLNGHVHTFRHSFISHAVIRGVPEAVIREWVGHVDPAILRHYTHIADAASKQQMDRLFETGPASTLPKATEPIPHADPT